MSISLSICIPTYNKASYIGETINSILTQVEDELKDEVQIVISDNGSTDNTEDVVRAYQKTYNNIKYYRHAKNMGFDMNVMSVIDLAEGKYCWFLGSDDKLESKAIVKVLSLLKKYDNIAGASIACCICDQNMNKTNAFMDPTLGKYEGIKFFKRTSECLCVLGHYFGFFSGQIVNRKLWLSISQKEKWKNYCRGFIHVYIILNMVKLGGQWISIPDKLVGWRSNNDDLLASLGLYERIKFDIIRYEEVLRDALGPDSIEYEAITNVIISHHLRAAIIKTKLNNIDVSTNYRILILCFKYYYKFSKFWFYLVPWLLMPSFLVNIIRKIYRKYKNT